MNEIGVDLPQRDQRPRMLPASAKCDQKSRPVALNGAPCVLFGESEIESLATVYARSTAWACGKSVHEPRQSLKTIRVKNSDF